jgi:signal transduction histidine kinase
VGLTRRLLLGALLVVGVLVVVLVAIVSGRLAERLRAEVGIILASEARLVASGWRPEMNADSLADAAGAALGRRVTLVAPDGRVLGDSEFDGEALARLDDHGSRPEIVRALAAGTGTSERTSGSTGGARIYVAVRAVPGVARLSTPTRTIRVLVTGARNDVLVAGGAALVVALLLAWIFARAIARPLVELRDVARGLAGGDLAQRPPLSAPGEVGDLAAALNRMTEQLAERLGAMRADEALMAAVIESLEEGVVAIDARRLIVRLNESAREVLGVRAPLPVGLDQLPRERMLREAVDAALDGESTPALEVRLDGRILAITARPLPQGGAVLAMLDLTPTRRLEAVRRDFVANVSHELKTPLTVVHGFAEAIADDPEMPADQRRHFAESIRSNAYRMQRIVDDLLDLSRIESGRWTPVTTPLDVESAALDATAAASAAAEQKGVRFAIEAAPSAPIVDADPIAFRQIVGNLAENAVRYTREGRVVVYSRADDEGTWVGVRDTGIGIPSEHIPRIFERFYRVDPGRSREAGGTGLGLAIVRHLAEAHGGRVRAESQVGRGTTIEVLFPTRHEARQT